MTPLPSATSYNEAYAQSGLPADVTLRRLMRRASSVPFEVIRLLSHPLKFGSYASLMYETTLEDFVIMQRAADVYDRRAELAQPKGKSEI